MADAVEPAFAAEWGGPVSPLFAASYESGPALQPLASAQPDWRPPPRPVEMPSMPSSLSDFHVYPREAELGLARSTLASVRALTAELPYGPSMLAAGRLASALRYVIADPHGQLALAQELFGEVAGLARLEAFLAQDPRHLLFSERHFFVLQRLLVDHAEEGYGSFETPITEAQADTFKRVLLALSTILHEADARLIKKTPMNDDMWLAYTVKHNAYFDQADWRAAASRSYAILATRARRSTHPLARSIDTSIQMYFSPMEQQLAVGFAFAQQAGLLESGLRAAERPIVARGIFSGTGLDEGTGIFEHVSSARGQYEVYFRLDGNARGMTWDRLQFMRWPYLRMAGNVATSPRTALNWLSDSLYYHALDAARNEERQPEFITWVEALVRDYAVDLVESVHLGAGVRRDTGPDALIELDGDCIVLAVCPGRLTRKALVDGDLAVLHGELDEKLYEPARRLGAHIRAMLEAGDRPGCAVWPILVTAGVAHCELLADRLEAELGTGDHAQVRSLTLLDLEDLELLCALVEHGEPLVSVLREKDGSGRGRLGLRRFLTQRDLPLPAAPTYLVQEDLERLCGAVNALLFPADEPRGLRDASAVSQRQSLVDTGVAAPLGEFVRRLRAERGAEDVPWFDPFEAGVNARILLLHDAPDPNLAPARGGSGLVSSDNDDATSEAMWHLLREAGIDRRADIVTWNIVPWYVDPDRGPSEADVAAAQPWLQRLIYLLYGMSVVVFLGERAREGWHLNISRAELLGCPHPSDARPGAREEILATLVKARELAHPPFKG